MKNTFNNNRFLFKFIYGVILAEEFNLKPTFLQMSLMWALMVSFGSNVTPDRFLHRLLHVFVTYVICATNKTTFVWISFHLIILKPFGFCKLIMTSSKLLATTNKKKLLNNKDLFAKFCGNIFCNVSLKISLLKFLWLR